MKIAALAHRSRNCKLTVIALILEVDFRYAVLKLAVRLRNSMGQARKNFSKNTRCSYFI
jgi:hypothetical protein